MIENRPALQVIQDQDDEDGLIYCDPPYVHALRTSRRCPSQSAYAHEMTDADHVELSHVLHQVRSSVVVSGYRGELYDGLYVDWVRVDKANVTVSNSKGGAKRTESLWLSPRCAANLQQKRLGL